MAFALWVFTWSIFQRNPPLLDGGDNLMVIVLGYLVVVDTGQHLAVRGTREETDPESLRWRLGTLLHNAGLLLIVVQVCVVYLASALFKAAGELWQNGTALYYVLRVQEFALPGVSELLYTSPLVVTAATYGTVLFQLAFPFLLFNRVTRLIAFAGAVMMHSGIAVLMGLVTFSWIMSSVEFVLIDEDRYRGMARRARRARDSLAERRRPSTELARI